MTTIQNKIRIAFAVLFTVTILIPLTFVIPKSVSANYETIFKDIEHSYAKQAIIQLHSKNVISGTAKETYSPKKPMTRAEFMTTLIRMLNLDSSISVVPAYSDVPTNAWFYGTIQAATEIGITEGMGNGYFEPDKTITRQEAAAWIVRIFKQNTRTIYSTAYLDDVMISNWARTYVDAVSRLGLMEGSNDRFYPTKSLTREEAAMLLYRVTGKSSWMQALDSQYAEPIHLGWQYSQTTAQYKQSLADSMVNVLSPRWFFLNSDGKIGNNADPSLVTWANKNGKKVWAMVGNRFDDATTHKMLASPELSAAAVRDLKSFVTKYGLHGINVDFENVKPADRELLSSFIDSLAKELDTVSATLSIDVSPDLGTDWTDAFDYKALGKSVDYVVLMGYDEHWTGGIKAGSVASLPWVTKGLDTLIKEVPAHKTILGMPLYNREWEVNQAGKLLSSRDILLGEQSRFIQSNPSVPKWDAKLGQYVMNYTKSDIPQQMWLEESRSLSRKYEMGANRKVAGYAYWHVGGETPEVWPSLRNMERYSLYQFE